MNRPLVRCKFPLAHRFLSKRNCRLLLAAVLVFTFLVVRRYREEIHYVYDPYYHGNCHHKKDRKYLDYYVDRENRGNADTYMESGGFNNRTFECSPPGPFMRMLWSDYQKTPLRGVIEGGSFSPKTCRPRTRVGVLVPYRGRPVQLEVFSNNIHKFLVAQNLEYTVFVIHQDDSKLFNRAALLNVGFIEATKLGDFSCFVFHDVDTFPTNLLNRYDCVSSPRHHRVVDDELKYYAPYSLYSGGVTSVSADHFRQVNGFSNLYSGWGLEDDDFFERLKAADLHMKRYHTCLSTYYSLNFDHTAQYTYSVARFLIFMSQSLRRRFDGLNSVDYEFINATKGELVTNFHVKFVRNNKIELLHHFFFDLPFTLLYGIALVAVCVVLRLFILPNDGNTFIVL